MEFRMGVKKAIVVLIITMLYIALIGSVEGFKPRKTFGRIFRKITPRLAQLASRAYCGGPWQLAHATFYGDETAQETMGGACGYGNLYSSGYGTETTALSSVLFSNGNGCGRCYEILCVNSPHCYRRERTIVTATNLCPPNWELPSNNGGWCNPPRVHFDMSKPAFMKIANWVAGIIPVMHRRVPCSKRGGIKFTIQGNNWWALVYITNVGGPGDIASVAVKGSNTGWISMTQNWGASYQAFHCFTGQSLSFPITSYTTRKTVIAWNAIPANWQLGQTYESNVQLS